MIKEPRSADQLRLILINDPKARLAISSCFFFVYELLYPSCVWEWVKDCPEWDMLVRVMTRSVPYWPTCDAGHWWNSTLSAASCQVCGKDNDERRLVIKFVVPDHDGAIITFIFTCLHVEWTEALAVLRKDKLAEGGEQMRLDYPVDGVYPHLRYPQAGLEFDRITDLEILHNSNDCENAIAALHLPRVTPSFLKRLIAAPCEPGKHGRCFARSTVSGTTCCVIR